MNAVQGTDQLGQREALSLLQTAAIGRLTFVIAGQPYTFPVNVAADATGAVVFRTGDHSTLSGIAGSKVCFEIDGYDTRRKSGWCVLVLGTAREITAAQDDVAMRLRRLDVTPWAPGSRDRWFTIDSTSISGRRVENLPEGFFEGWFAGVPMS